MIKKNDMLNIENTERFKQDDQARVQVLQNCVPLDLSNDLKRVATTPGGEEVSSGRGDLPTDRVRFEEHDEKEYEKHLRRFFKGDDTRSDK